jgi:hypothetical protein
MVQCSIAFVELGVIAMNLLIEKILDDCKLAAHDVDHNAGTRAKISGYLETLVSSGQRDAQYLKLYAMAYLRELREGPDPGFTGC